MALVLAIEPDLRQAAILKRVIHERVHAELVVVDSRDAAVAALSARVPDVILLTALLSPRDEDEMIAHLRSLAGADHVQTHTIPQLASSRPDDPEQAPSRGLLGKFRRKKESAPIAGCDPTLFADEVSEFIVRAQELKGQAIGTMAREETSAVAAALSQWRDTPETAAQSPVSAQDAEPSNAASAWASPFEWRKPDAAAEKTEAEPRHGGRPSLVSAAPLAVVAEEDELRREREAAVREQAEAERERERLEAEAAAKRERDRIEAEARRERERVEAEAAAKRERERAEAEAAAKKERERVEAEARAKKERERLEAEAKAKKERERLEAEAAAKRERERLEAEAKAKKERERLEAEAKARKERERLEAEAAAKRERERLEAEAKAKKERERLEAEAAAKRERERLEAEARAKKERERLEAEAAAKRERERLEAEARAKKERERLEAEAKAKKERERLEAEAAAKRERERLEAEAAARRERERAAAEAAREAERLREVAAAAERERIRLELEAAEREELRLQADAAAVRERERLEAQAALVELQLKREAAELASAAADAPAADSFAEFRLDAEEAQQSLLKLMPLAIWARRETPAAVAAPASRDELDELIAGLSLPNQVAGVSYARGCRIRRVRVPASAVPPADGAPPVILSKRALAQMRAGS